MFIKKWRVLVLLTNLDTEVIIIYGKFRFLKKGEEVFKGEFNKTKFEFVNVKKFTYDDLEAG